MGKLDNCTITEWNIENRIYTKSNSQKTILSIKDNFKGAISVYEI